MDRNDSQLVLRDIPIFLWFFGLIFAGVGVLIFIDGGRAPAMGLVFAATGLGFLLFPGILTITADRITRTLKLEYRSVLRYKLKEFLFDEIAGIGVERSIGHGKGGSSYTYGVVVKRKDGTVTPFHSYSSSGSRKKERQAGQLRDFIGVQGFDDSPAGISAAVQPNAGEIHETDGIHWQIQRIGTGGSTGARWHSSDFKTPGVFLLVAQKAEGHASQGFMASLGSMIFTRSLPLYGFQPCDTPSLDQASTLGPLDPALESHFMAFSNNPSSASQMLNAAAVMPLASWAGRYPLKQLQKGKHFSQLVVLFGPNGVYLATLDLLQPEQVNELATLGAELVKSQISSRRQ